MADPVQRRHRNIVQVQGLVVEVGRDDRLRLVAEDRLVELRDHRGLPGHQLVPHRSTGHARRHGADVFRALPDAEDRPARVRGDGEPPCLARVQRADRDRPAAGANGLRGGVGVVRGEVGGPGDREMPVGRQLTDAGDLLPVQQPADVGAQLIGTRPELPVEQGPVELLGRGQAVHDQTHPARCSGRAPGGGLGHRLLSSDRCGGRAGDGTGTPSRVGKRSACPVQMLAPLGAGDAPAAPRRPGSRRRTAGFPPAVLTDAVTGAGAAARGWHP